MIRHKASHHCLRVATALNNDIVNFAGQFMPFPDEVCPDIGRQLEGQEYGFILPAGPFDLFEAPPCANMTCVTYP